MNRSTNITRTDKRNLFVWLVKRVGNRLDVSAKHIDNNTFRLTVGAHPIDLPYDYWTDWTLGEMIDYVKEVIL